MRYLSFKELQEKLGGRGHSTIYRDVALGRLPQPLKIGGRPGMMQGQGMHDQMMGGMGGHMMGGGPAKHIEGRLAFLKTELGITDAQMDVWQDYAAAIRSSVDSMQEMHTMMMSGDAPTSFPARIERRKQMMSARIETLRTLREAAVPLYEALDDQQKRVADSIMGMGMM